MEGASMRGRHRYCHYCNRPSGKTYYSLDPVTFEPVWLCDKHDRTAAATRSYIERGEVRPALRGAEREEVGA